MSNVTPMILGSPTVVAAVTATTQAKALGDSLSLYVVITNIGSNPAFVNSGANGITIVYPTSGTGQNGKTIPANSIVTYKKNNAKDTHLACICDTGLTTTLHISTGGGV